MHTVIKKNQLTTANWKGGTTTQLFIYPQGTEYQKFNFDFRMSYATVEIPESTFTFMPGVTRHLMILRGELEIDHTNRYKKHLKKFDQDVFDGEWPTTAKGMVMDFNLMTRNGAKGMLEAIVLLPGDVKQLTLTGEFDYTGIYILSGQITLDTVNEKTVTEAGDFALFEHRLLTVLHISSPSGSEIIVARVKKPVHS